MVSVYIGYDSQFGDAAYKVCVASILRHASGPVHIVKLEQSWLRRIGLYRRQFYVEDGQRFDARDGKPFSTEFSFTRFLVPCLQPHGWAIFCDSDFLFRADVYELKDLQVGCAVRCVQHKYEPPKGTKMLGQVQEPYWRKNWSSLMMWNCDHPSTQMLTPYTVNNSTGAFLHQLKWLKDDEIGDIPEMWNWLDGHSSEDIDPKAVHFTRGTPDMEGWEDTKYAQEWLDVWSSL